VAQVGNAKYLQIAFSDRGADCSLSPRDPPTQTVCLLRRSTSRRALPLRGGRELGGGGGFQLATTDVSDWSGRVKGLGGAGVLDPLACLSVRARATSVLVLWVDLRGVEVPGCLVLFGVPLLEHCAEVEVVLLGDGIGGRNEVGDDVALSAGD
jgi:hypothetical protein